MSDAGTTFGNRYRHVVFAAAPVRPPLNLGAISGAPSTSRTRAVARFAPALAPVDLDIDFVNPVPCDGAPNVDEADVASFFAWIFLEAGLSARHYRPGSLRRRLPACLRALRVEDVAQARRLLRRQPQFVPVAVGSLLLGVTEFFRDESVFAQIESELPDLLRAARTDARRPLRVWSAGCSEGAELYSVAMLLAELNALDACELLGTDCREEALGCAAAGRFGPCILRGLSAERLERFTFPDGDDRSAVAAGQRRVNQNLRAVARWRRGNLIAGSEAGPWDLVLCRNMAMYLQPLAAKRLWRGLVSSIRPGGLLVLGKAERPCPAVSAELSPVAACVYRRRLRHHGVP